MRWLAAIAAREVACAAAVGVGGHRGGLPAAAAGRRAGRALPRPGADRGLLLAHDGRWGEPASLGARGPGWPGRRSPEAIPRARPEAAPAGALRRAAPGRRCRARRRWTPSASRRPAAADRGATRPTARACWSPRSRPARWPRPRWATTALPWRADMHDDAADRAARPAPGAAGHARRAGWRWPADRRRPSAGPVNPDSPAEVLRASPATGCAVPSTRAWVLRRVEHPAAPLLLEYKELARLHTAHGWAWLDPVGAQRPVPSGVRGRAAWCPGGGPPAAAARCRSPRCCGGRWSPIRAGNSSSPTPRSWSRGCSPRSPATPGWPRPAADERPVQALAAGRSAATGPGPRSRCCRRDVRATGGEAGRLLAALRRRFPVAVGYVEAAARDGEAGGLVRSRLGRTCPPPSAAWRELTDGPATSGEARRPPGPAAGSPATSWCRRRAADWALVLLAALRPQLSRRRAGRRPGLLPARRGGAAHARSRPRRPRPRC